MSSTLVWKPVKPNKCKSLDCSLKFALQKRFGSPVNVIFSSREMLYLEGLVDAGIKDAQKVIDALIKHGEVELKEVF